MSIDRKTVQNILTLGICLFLACLQVPPALAQEQDVYVLKASEWNVPRTTDAILSMPALNKTVQAFSKHPGSRIRIRYPGGDVLPGSRDPGQLELQVITPPGQNQVSH